MKTINQKQAVEAIAKGETFEASALTSRYYTNEMRNTGRIGGADYDAFYEANQLNTGGLWYVVYSYGTPIAWQNCVTGEWHLVTQKFSSTTSRHQSIVRKAVA